jgi:hypothetical protein
VIIRDDDPGGAHFRTRSAREALTGMEWSRR